MATQGLVSVVSGNGHVLAKAIAGCDGMQAKELADLIEAGQLRTAKAIFKVAKRVGFGSERDLVVMDSLGNVETEIDEDLPPLYRDTFNNPHFNPRWEHGTAAYAEVVTLTVESRKLHTSDAKRQFFAVEIWCDPKSREAMERDFELLNVHEHIDAVVQKNGGGHVHKLHMVHAVMEDE